MSTESRREAFTPSAFDVSGPIRGHVVFLDDLIASGSTRDAVLNVCRLKGIAESQISTVTIAKFREDVNPSRENDLNHNFVLKTNGIQALKEIAAGSFIPHARNCFYLLSGSATKDKDLLFNFFLMLGEKQPKALVSCFEISQILRHKNDPVFLENLDLLRSVMIQLGFFTQRGD